MSLQLLHDHYMFGNLVTFTKLWKYSFGD